MLWCLVPVVLAQSGAWGGEHLVKTSAKGRNGLRTLRWTFVSRRSTSGSAALSNKSCRRARHCLSTAHCRLGRSARENENSAGHLNVRHTAGILECAVGPYLDAVALKATCCLSSSRQRLR